MGWSAAPAATTHCEKTWCEKTYCEKTAGRLGGSMNILGINSTYHETAAAVLVDGELVAAAEEERFNRIKHGKEFDVDNAHQFPEHAIRFCLDYAGLRASDIDHVAYSFDPQLRRKQFRSEW